MVRVAVTGGRDFNDRDLIFAALDHFHEQREDEWVLVHGAAAGADYWSAKWAKLRGIEAEAHSADWDTHGKGAGPIRNQEMIDSGLSLCIAFPGGRGTQDMKRRCVQSGVELIEVIPQEEEE